MQVYVSRLKAARASEMRGKFAVTMECSCLQQDLAAQGESLWVCGHSGNFTDIFLMGWTWRPVPGFPREHIKEKECSHLAFPPQRQSHPGRGQCLCTAPAAALVWDHCTNPGSRTEAKVFHVLHVHLKTACSPALHAWISSSSFHSLGAIGSFDYPHTTQQNQYLSTVNKEIKYNCLACRQSHAVKHFCSSSSPKNWVFHQVMGSQFLHRSGLFSTNYSASKPKNFILFPKPLPDVTTFQNFGLLKAW